MPREARVRLDVFLQRSRLIRRRSQSKLFCDAGAVHVNGKVAKGSKPVRVGDRVRVAFWNRSVEVVVTELVERAGERGAPSRLAFEVVLEERKDLLR